jgi:hypothetical protein
MNSSNHPLAQMFRKALKYARDRGGLHREDREDFAAHCVEQAITTGTEDINFLNCYEQFLNGPAAQPASKDEHEAVTDGILGNFWCAVGSELLRAEARRAEESGSEELM